MKQLLQLVIAKLFFTPANCAGVRPTLFTGGKKVTILTLAGSEAERSGQWKISLMRDRREKPVSRERKAAKTGKDISDV